MEGFDLARLPLDAVWLDIDHTPDFKYFLVDELKFNLQRLFDKLACDGRFLVGRNKRGQRRVPSLLPS